jgi:lantibiotic immunity protein
LKTKFSIFTLLLIAFLFLGACSTLKELGQTAKKNMAIDRTLPKYQLNMENFREISYQGRTYMIQETAVHPSQLEEPIGKVAESVTINEQNEILSKEELRKIEIFPKKQEEKRIHLHFGWVYSLKNISPDEEVAVVVNHEYRIAKIKK